jgi:tRNA dimethylallyltransferase
MLDADRQLLYERINRRVDKMLDSGLLDEVKTFSESLSSAQSFQAIGYKELIEYLNGHISMEEAVELLKKNTRNYAKRQLTWMRRYTDAVKFDFTDGIGALKLAEETFKK